MRYLFPAFLALLLALCSAHAQVLTRRPEESAPKPPASTPATEKAEDIIPLTAPAGTSLKVVLDKEVRVRRAGQPLHAKTAEPTYAFDTLVVPAGSEVLGRVSEIEPIGWKRRLLAGMNANFTPPHKIHVEFDELVLGDGRHLALHTGVSPASGGVLQFVPAGQRSSQQSQNGSGNFLRRKLREARQQVKQQMADARAQLHQPGKMHRLKRYGLARLPIHPQYLDAGASFNADLLQPLDFGTEALQPDALAAIGTQPPNGSVIHASLVTPLNSAISKKDDPVEAVINQPLFVSNRLLLPQGSHLQGAVLQSRPARRLGRNGHLRIVFHQVVPPSGVQQRVEASLEGVEVAKGEHLALDSEGGAEVTSPRSRYLTTAITVVLATSALSPDRDAQNGPDAGDVGGGAANGAFGFGLVGTVVGAVARSRAVSSGFGVYGASMSVYSHFLARGHDVVYPKDMSMLIGLSTPDPNQPNSISNSAPANTR